MKTTHTQNLTAAALIFAIPFIAVDFFNYYSAGSALKNCKTVRRALSIRRVAACELGLEE